MKTSHHLNSSYSTKVSLGDCLLNPGELSLAIIEVPFGCITKFSRKSFINKSNLSFLFTESIVHGHKVSNRNEYVCFSYHINKGPPILEVYYNLG